MKHVKKVFALFALAGLLVGCATTSNSALGSFSYNADTQVLSVKFDKGGVYEYAGVPADVFDQLKKAESQGEVFNQLVKGQYKSKKVSD